MLDAIAREALTKKRFAGDGSVGGVAPPVSDGSAACGDGAVAKRGACGVGGGALEAMATGWAVVAPCGGGVAAAAVVVCRYRLKVEPLNGRDFESAHLGEVAVAPRVGGTMGAAAQGELSLPALSRQQALAWSMRNDGGCGARAGELRWVEVLFQPQRSVFGHAMQHAASGHGAAARSSSPAPSIQFTSASARWSAIMPTERTPYLIPHSFTPAGGGVATQRLA